ncbi:DNA internalization-related competence protein ComEC/Rec2 [Candidatus Halobeggiatoa sp. HSG11]|nr:DNA internalization-related competence protein ComEC/Rec2 [Candidatus Halobeggiatoa sp. HSG11]
MRLSILAFFFGILYCQTLTELPDLIWFLLALPLVKFPRTRLLFFFVLGLAYAVFRADIILAQKVPIELTRNNIKITGTIIGTPYQHGLIFSPKATEEWPNPGLIYLKYSPNVQYEMIPGQKWRLTVRLKQIRTTSNPDSFNLETWLFKNSIAATGSIRSATYLQEFSLLNINNIRHHLAEELKTELAEYQSVGIIIALALGDRSAIPTPQKEILRHANISHLIAISGLHIGFIAWLTFIISRSLWKYMGSMALLFPAPRFAALASIFFATNYAMLAGFSLPTQRALIMVMVALFGIIFNYKIAASKIFAITLLLILLLEPLTVLSIEFWLSFGTVAIIFYGLTGYPEKGNSFLEKNFMHIIKIQIIVTVGLFPILLFIFGYVSLLSFAANFIAIPWTSFIVIPFTLLGIILLPLTSGLLHIAAFTFDAILIPIIFLANLDWNLWQQKISLFTLITSMIGIFILLLPKGFPAKWLGFIWLLPLFNYPQYHSNNLKQGEVWFTLLDVGQGLSAVIRTKNHVLIYDTGPSKYIGRTVIIPFLRAKKIQHIDKLVISHTDKDHDGGVEAILNKKYLSVAEILTSAVDEYKTKYPKYKVEPCQADINHWVWDEVTFQILHPPADFKFKNTNDISCVLKITNGNNSILLPGDISSDVELQLITSYKSKLKTDVLVASHHGSASSSSISFINIANPKIVLFSSGYNNKYNHPRKNIEKRYEKYRILTQNTADSGAINLNLTTDGIFGPDIARKKFYWYE